MKRFFSIITSNIILGFLAVDKVLAQTDIFGRNRLTNGDTGNAIALGSSSIEGMIANIINITLGFLGIIALLLILYAGFLWMTSAGNTEKIQKAKLILISAIIGLLIIVSAYAISTFILDRLADATGNTEPGEPGDPDIPPIVTCAKPFIVDEMKICDISPMSGPEGTRVTISGWYFDTYDATNSYVVFDDGTTRTPAEVTTCGGGTINWSETNTDYYNITISVPNVPVGDYNIEVGNNATGESDFFLSDSFTVNNDTPGPGIDCLVPNVGPNGQNINIYGVRFGGPEAGNNVFMESNTGLTITDVADTTWSDELIQMSIEDDAISSDLIVSVGGINSNPKFFSVTCTDNNDCLSNCCGSGYCRTTDFCAVLDPEAPYIDSISPDAGTQGNLVTIYGSNFETTPGTVLFDGLDINNNPIVIPGIIPDHAQCLNDYWFDDHIIIQVPANISAIGQVNINTANNEASNAVEFREDNTVRPGICHVDPGMGVFEDSVTIYGNNFDVNDEVLFGGISGYNTVISPDPNNPPDDDSATSNVPNLQAGEVGLQVEASNGEISNALPFTVLVSGGGKPVITDISYPDSDTAAPVGQYITVLGANFGNIPNEIYFETTLGDFNFPVQCLDSYWRNDRIIVKVPAGLGASGVYPLQVVRNDGATSNDFDFNLDNALDLKPGICKMSPDNGPAGTTAVDFFGDNFGSSSGRVRFYNTQEVVNPPTWNNQQVLNILVPANTQTGPVVIEHVNGNTSNEMMFNVGTCPDNDDLYCQNTFGQQHCCFGENGNYCHDSCEPEVNECEYPWTITTEALPFDLRYNYCGQTNNGFATQTPSPWPHLHDGYDSLDVYIDSNFLINFTRNVEDLTLIDPLNFQVYQCNTGGNFNNAACTIGPLTGTLSIVSHNSDSEGVIFNPSADLIEDTWYNVILGQNSFAATLGGDVWPVGAPPTWTFKTRANADSCIPTTVSVSPQFPDSNVYVGQTRNFTALASDDHCNICSDNYNWTWSMTDPTGANTISPLGNNNQSMGQTTLTGVQATANLTPNNYVNIVASLPALSINGDTQSIVQDAILTVIDHQPDCNASCGNAEVQVTFNTDVDLPINNNINYFVINEQGNPINLTTNLTFTGNVVTLNHADNFTPGRTYNVSIGTGVVNTGGYHLSTPYNWSFTIEADNCEFYSIDVIPDDREVTSPSQVINYQAIPYSDPAICGGQPLTCNGNCTWSWSIQNTSIANFTSATNIQTPQVRTNNTGLNGTTIITANESNSGLQGVDTLTTNYPPGAIAQLTVVKHWPDCDGTCDNSEVGALFNLPLDMASVNNTNFTIHDLNTGTNITNDILLFSEAVVINHQPLELGHTYEVRMLAAVQATNGSLLGQDFIWQFITGQSNCVVSDAMVIPANYTSTIPNESVSYTVLPLADSIQCGLTPIICPACTYFWTDNSSADVDISNTLIQSPNVNSLLSEGNGFANILGLVIDGTWGYPSDLSPFTINLGITPTFNRPEAVNPSPLSASACINVAASVEFTERMNSSIKDSVKLYKEGNVDTGNCLNSEPGVYLCEVNVRYSISSIDINGDGIYETRVVMKPIEYLDANSDYTGFVWSSATSQAGQPLAPASIIYDIDNNGSNDGYNWDFSSGSDICAISNVVIDPGSDLFTCASNVCSDDIDPAAGNQHEYSLAVYGLNGDTLNTIPMSINWGVNGPLLDITTTADSDIIYATPANQSGEELLTVNVSEATLGSANDSAEVDIFLCEMPWPSIDNIPWEDTDYNFSTYYCQAESVNDTTLPYLTVPTASSPLGTLREYIFVVDSLSYNNLSNLGTLARGEVKEPAKQTLWKKIAGLFKPNVVEGQALAPLSPINFNIDVTNETTITLSWEPDPNSSTIDGYLVERKSFSGSTWQELADITNTNFVDDTLIPDTSYLYQVWSYSNAGGKSLNPVQIQFIPNQSNEVDIIGIRVMSNDEHLSVSEWYKKKAPNAGASGSVMKIDGYEALQVGSTIYIAGTNLDINGNRLYTNIYIISHNLGADEDTRNIFNQMVNNFKLNINIDEENNVCSDNPTQSCSSDFDCAVGDTCNSRGLKLRRDLKRLSDLINIKSSIENYGNTHKACSNDASINCSINNQCPAGGSCVSYYPMLTSGSFVVGMSHSRWPVSWNNTFSSTLGMTLPFDPVNLLNGCPDEEADPNTCWNEDSQLFTCPLNSLIYLYNNTNNGSNYHLASNFEYDLDAINGITFANNLYPAGVDSGIDHIYASLTRVPANYCLSINLNAPGTPGSPFCGNGVKDGVSVEEVEECDGDIRDHMCRDTVLPLGRTWWNEQYGGCNPPEAVNSDGALIECTWYDPVPPLTAEQCGGYCGDGTIQPLFELCEGNNFKGVNYTCPEAGQILSCHPTYCQPVCNGNIPAVACGDGWWDKEGGEQCDSSANPNGLSEWNCTLGGQIYCNNTCQRECTAGIPYGGDCGDGQVITPEECDYASYVRPTPAESSITNPYTCSLACDFINQPYCGDGEQQYQFQELCDTSYIRPQTEDSGQNAQYSCSTTLCTPTIGGYCGDGTIQPLNFFGFCAGTNVTCNSDTDCSEGRDCEEYFDEVCDPGNLAQGISSTYTAPTPADSDIAHQYECAEDCLSIASGGYCGDGIVHNGVNLTGHDTDYGEECDDADITNDNVCSNSCTWNCTDDNNDGIPEGDVVTYSPITFNGSSSVVMSSGDTAAINLPHCRVSGDVITDIHVNPGVTLNQTTGIVFVTDVSPSMEVCMSDSARPPLNKTCEDAFTWLDSWNMLGEGVIYHDHPATPGDTTRLEAAKLAIAGSGGAFDTIYDINPTADITTIHYWGDNPFVPPPWFVNDNLDKTGSYDFVNISSYLADLKSWVNGYTMVGGTAHLPALTAANDAFDKSTVAGIDYDNKIIVFLTDGGFATEEVVNYSDVLKAKGIDLFTVTLTNIAMESDLISFVNRVSSSNCTCSLIAGGLDPQCDGTDNPDAPLTDNFLTGYCGDGVIDCATQNYSIFEECDSVVGCNSNTCQWIDTKLKRAYNYIDNPDLSAMYQSILGSIPLSGIRADFGSGFVDLGIPNADGDILDFVINTNALNNGGCNETSGPNNLEFMVDFSGDATIMFSNARYNFCPWTNGYY